MNDGMPKLRLDRPESFFALAFVGTDDDIVACEPVECISASAAIGCARGLVARYGTLGAMALRKPDRQNNLLVLCAFGQVPNGEPINLARGWHVAPWNEEWGCVDVFG